MHHSEIRMSGSRLRIQLQHFVKCDLGSVQVAAGEGLLAVLKYRCGIGGSVGSMKKNVLARGDMRGRWRSDSRGERIREPFTEICEKLLGA